MVTLSFKESPPKASIRGVNNEDKKKSYSGKFCYTGLWMQREERKSSESHPGFLLKTGKSHMAWDGRAHRDKCPAVTKLMQMIPWGTGVDKLTTGRMHSDYPCTQEVSYREALLLPTPGPRGRASFPGILKDQTQSLKWGCRAFATRFKSWLYHLLDE